MNWIVILVVVSVIISIIMNLAVGEPVIPLEKTLGIILGAIIFIVVVIVTIGIFGAWAVLALVAFAIVEGSKGDGIQ